MEKRQYKAPYLRVVAIKNNIIATSQMANRGSNRDGGPRSADAPDRDFGWDDEDW